MSVNFTFRNYDRVRNALRFIAANIPKLTDDVMQSWTKDMRATLKAMPYPAMRPAQKYVRTGRLPNSWSAVRVKVGTWTIVNSATSPITGKPYPHYVVGDGQGIGQAWMHKNRWWKASDVIGGHTADLTARMTDKLIAYWRANG